MLQEITPSRSSASSPPDTAPGEPVSSRFYSFKNDLALTAPTNLHLALFRLLECEPCVQAYEPLADGAVDVRYWGGRLLAAVLPSKGQGYFEAMALKRRYEAEGRRLILAPERRLARWPHRETCRIISECGGTTLAPTDRLVVLEALTEKGGDAHLGDLACLLPRHEDPVSGVLSLVLAGVLRVDLSRPITALSKVTIFDPFAGAR